MENKNAFTLPEMVAVIAILMLLAALSTPFVRGYIDDAYNGKAQIYMRQLQEARLNFEKDYPGATISDNGTETQSSDCKINEIYDANALKPTILEKCNYLKPVSADLTVRYAFTMGPVNQNAQGGCSSTICAGNDIVITMRGLNDAGKYKSKCTCMDPIGNVYKESPEGD